MPAGSPGGRGRTEGGEAEAEARRLEDREAATEEAMAGVAAVAAVVGEGC